MDLNNLTLFDMAKQRMDWLAQREKVVATNIANADTPEFRPSDLQPLDFKQVLRDESRKVQNVGVLRTDPAHLPGTIPERGPFLVEDVRRAYEVSPDGNAVVLEDQAQKLAEARGQYDLTTGLFQKYVRMLRTALGRGAG